MRYLGASIVALMFAAVFFAAEQPVQAESQNPQTQIQTVKSGDTLSGIAREHGMTYRRLFEANGFIDDPDLIYPGDEIRIPAAGEQGAAREAATTTPAPQPRPEPEPEPVAQTEPAPAVPSGGVWDRLAQCESGGDWNISTGNGFYGGLQFQPSTWAAFGGHEYAPNAHQATRAQQIRVAERTQAAQGWGAWPACTAKLGIR